MFTVFSLNCVIFKVTITFPRYLGDLGLRSVGTPRISIGPAGYRNRDYARRGWATETGHPNWGPRDPGQCMQAGIKTVMVVSLSEVMYGFANGHKQ